MHVLDCNQQHAVVRYGTYINVTSSHLRSKEFISVHKPCIPHSRDTTKCTPAEPEPVHLQWSGQNSGLDYYLTDVVMCHGIHSCHLCGGWLRLVTVHKNLLKFLISLYQFSIIVPIYHVHIIITIAN